MSSHSVGPDIERISTNWRRPGLVVLAAVALIGVLLWKPWDQSSPAPRQNPVTALPTPLPTPTASPTLPAPTTPVIVVDVRYGGGGGAFVECEYRPGTEDFVLAQLTIGPPYVQLNALLAAARSVRRVAWRAELQVNRLDSIFSAAWEPILETRRNFATDLNGEPLDLPQIIVDYKEQSSDPTLVVRVVVVADWFGPHRAWLGSREIVAATYAHGPGRPVRQEGCQTHLDRH